MQSRTHTCGELRLEHVGKKVQLAGWLENVREVGGNLAFVVVRDFYGKTQLVVEDEELLRQLKGINKESTIGVVGIVRERASKNPNLPTGDIEVVPESIKVLGRCRYNELPFEINRSRDADETQRLKYRYLDLRNPAVKQNIILRCKVIAAIRKAMQEHDFIPVIAPVGVGEDGQAFNINADLVAGAVAAELGALKLILLTDLAGVKNSQGELISTIYRDQIDPLIEEGGHIILSTSVSRRFVTLPYEFPAVSHFTPWGAYAQSKLALTLFSIYMSSVMKTRRVSVNCVNPGLLKSGALAMARWMDRVPDYLTRNIPSPEAGVVPTLRALESKDTGYLFAGADKQVKTSTMLKNREMFIRVCNDTMRILKEYLNKENK